MRKNKRRFKNCSNELCGNFIPYGNVTINRNVTNVNVTNVSNVANVSNFTGLGSHEFRKRRRRAELGFTRKRPRLLGFYETCGLKDRDVAGGMSESEFVDGTLDVIGYESNKAKNHIKGIGNNIAGAAGGMCQMACGVGNMVSGTFKFIASIFR